MQSSQGFLQACQTYNVHVRWKKMSDGTMGNYISVYGLHGDRFYTKFCFFSSPNTRTLMYERPYTYTHNTQTHEHAYFTLSHSYLYSHSLFRSLTHARTHVRIKKKGLKPSAHACTCSSLMCVSGCASHMNTVFHKLAPLEHVNFRSPADFCVLANSTFLVSSPSSSFHSLLSFIFLFKVIFFFLLLRFVSPQFSSCSLLFIFSPFLSRLSPSPCTSLFISPSPKVFFHSIHHERSTFLGPKIEGGISYRSRQLLSLSDMFSEIPSFLGADASTVFYFPTDFMVSQNVDVFFYVLIGFILY